MQGRELHYFACANSSKGFVNFFDSNLDGLDKIYILKGGPGTGKSSLMKTIGQRMKERGLDVELIHCSSDPDSLDGVILRKIKTAIVDGTAPHVIEPKVPGAIEEYVNLGEAWNTRQLGRHTIPITDLEHEIEECFKKAYEQFHKALKIHDEWENIYIHNMEFAAVNELCDEVIHRIFEGVTEQEEGSVIHRFFGGATPNGVVDFVMNVIEPMEKRYFIKGRPGSGKSTMLRKIQQQAENLCLNVEVYHCGFDPDSLDMIRLPQISVCIFDSTAPHEYEPSRESDEVIDVYAKAIRPGTDEENERQLKNIKERYRALVGLGTWYLQKAKQHHDTLEAYYVAATDFTVTEKIMKKLMKEIEDRIEE